MVDFIVQDVVDNWTFLMTSLLDEFNAFSRTP